MQQEVVGDKENFAFFMREFEDESLLIKDIVKVKNWFSVLGIRLAESQLHH